MPISVVLYIVVAAIAVIVVLVLATRSVSVLLRSPSVVTTREVSRTSALRAG